MDEKTDNELLEATRTAGNVYFGAAFRLGLVVDPDQGEPRDADVHKYLEMTKWKVAVDGDFNNFYVGKNPLITFSALARASKGLGYLNLHTDWDGAFRRLPLLVQYDDAFYPSFSFQVVCNYLGVFADNIIVKPGKTITLKDARLPRVGEKRDIVIPIDKHGNMRVNFVGSWGRMKHYNFSDIYYASRDRDELEMWKEELSGKIVLISDIFTGSSDLGPVPTDSNFPLSGVHANSVHTILTESFLRELSGIEMLFVELSILFGVMMLSFRFSALPFTLSTFGVVGGYLCISGLLLVYENVIFNIIRPLLMVGFTLISIQIASAIENTRLHAETQKAKELAERDLEIGRQIQSGFLPTTLPHPSGWEFVAYFKGARQVAGDFYDVFNLGNGQRIGIVIADVCDKGVGAALFMALIRSLIRAFAIQNFDDPNQSRKFSMNPSHVPMLSTIRQANNYIAEIHSDANMFATLFFGVLDPKSGGLNYINCGHEPPIVSSQMKVGQRLKPTGPALGLMPDSEYKVLDTQFNPGDILFAFTDGVTEAQNRDGEFFTKERLLSLLSKPADSAEALIDRVINELYNHISDGVQSDDVTMIAVRQKKRA
jgi:serine phosphatase RsbU (regulator of sigma subunit)